jgi:hypothetical protein
VFAELTLPPGVISLEACATDPSGNHACTGACELVVGDVPNVVILAPAADHVVYSVDLSSQGVAYRNAPPADVDCAPGQPGLQIPVAAQVSDAAAGRAARVKLLSAQRSLVQEVETSVALDGSVSACVDSVEGVGLVLRVEVDAEEAGLYGAAERRIEVDTEPPLSAPMMRADPVGCRGPSVVHIDTDGSVASEDELGFELRCAASAIENESDWSAAQRVAGEPNPDPSGPGLSWILPGGLPGESRHCSLRGYDRAGAYTPLGEPLAIASPPLREQAIAVPQGLGTTGELTLTALGDVNGDGFDDVLLAGAGEADSLGGAALYLGSPSGLAATPTVRFVSQDSYQLGRSVAALGNFDDDPLGHMDFALGAPGSARLFVVLGRSTWPSGSVSVDAGGCGVDLCIQGDAHEKLGRSLASARFDADATPDLVAGAESAAVVILGNALYGPTATLGAAGAGSCLDARTSPQPDACGTGRSRSARGFRLEAPAPIDHLLSSEPGRLFLAHAGGAASPSIWYARRRNYNLVAELVRVPAAELTLVEQLASAPWGVLSLLGDLDGDGRAELGYGRGTSAGGLLVLTREDMGELRQAFSIHNDSVGAGDDRFAHSVAQGAHPELGLLGDIDGDGLADPLLGSHRAGGARGTVELFLGFQPLPDARARSSRALSFDDDSLASQPDPAEGAYPRSGHYLGDVDGDGHLELAVLEPAFAEGAARFIVLGACSGP